MLQNTIPRDERGVMCVYHNAVILDSMRVWTRFCKPATGILSPQGCFLSDLLTTRSAFLLRGSAAFWFASSLTSLRYCNCDVEDILHVPAAIRAVPDPVRYFEADLTSAIVFLQLLADTFVLKPVYFIPFPCVVLQEIFMPREKIIVSTYERFCLTILLKLW